MGDVNNLDHRTRNHFGSADDRNTKETYQYTSTRRNAHKQAVYSVNIPFSKQKQQGRINLAIQDPKHIMNKTAAIGDNPYQKSRAFSYMSPTETNN